MRALITCEFSGRVRQAMRERGVDAWSCDHLPSEDNSLFHIQGDALRAIVGGCMVGDVGLREPWDFIGIHYTCTFFALSSVQWLYLPREDDNPGRSTLRDPVRWKKMKDAAKELAGIYGAAVASGAKVYFENPQMHSYAQMEISNLLPGWSIKPTQKIQPYDYGHPETKGTCLWLHGLPPLVPTKIVRNEYAALKQSERAKVHYASPGKDRWKARSRTLPGIASAMAEQWGAL